MRVTIHLARLWLLALWLFGTSVAHGATIEVRLADRTNVSVERFGAGQDTVLLWLPSGLGQQASEERVAAATAALGIEVWRPDLLDARLLPPLESSLEKISGRDVADLIDAASAGGRRVYLTASARASALALTGAQVWRERHPDSAVLGGAILLHPNLYIGPPEPGREADFQPVVAQTRLPIFIVQPQRSPWIFRLDALKAALAATGSPVSVQLVPEVRDRYYFRPDATNVEEAEAARLPALFAQAIATLKDTKVGDPALQAARGKQRAPAAPRERNLRPYQGNPVPAPLRLTSLDGAMRDLADYRGQVVLINFWASWCPPCVREMPSLQRLKERFSGRPFVILAVNMAEDEATVRAFLKEKVNVDFPILMDRDGAALKRWKVFAFPTSFVVGSDGNLHSGLVGEAEWDSDPIVRALQALIPKAR
ncbi:MAG: hypothetical protein AMJ84_03290 [Acidithiobacillales bacterium SM23_46]|nr:MAG: hypothetical protein AMJ84_03290 [Acidithiobacillales bacterium SM23_46]